MNNKTLITIIVVLIIVVVIIAVGGKFVKKTSGPETNTKMQTQQQTGTTNTTKEIMVNVAITSSGFNPQTVTVKVGTRVIWLNKSGGLATVNSDLHPTHRLYTPLNLGEFPDGSSVQLVFDKPGTYKYHNHLNPSQTGTVVVQ